MTSQYTLVETAFEKTPKSTVHERATSEPSWRPYLDLVRLSKPAGLLGTYFPYVIGLFYSINVTDPKAFSAASCIKLIFIFLLDSLVLRSFGCAWNDTVDQDLDRQVERCKKRPLARGAITTSNALATTLTLAIARHILIYATLPARASQHAILTTVLALIYPFMKRLCNFPQLCLATGVGWAVFFVDAAVVDGDYATETVTNYRVQDRSKAMFALYACQTIFNMTYDTIYAFQDIQDDLKAGVGSLAVAVRRTPKLFLLSMAGAMAVCLWAAVFWGSLTRGPFLGGAAVSSFAALSMLVRLDVGNPRECRDFFVNSQWWVSGMLATGLVGELMMANM
ncbi:UbiA prenyltransferase family [Boeremia exigua]|uniref:UbiA prenyltransferase family n=1 Tax=Boeremia exigua TaxID=749465 RepID=UPI001E8D39D0|nr:UbiA prenyltransferase family [Boeremia exigua]KAH6613142.1 UbiA prenyltransferase family [Boeremia exigua]